MYIGNDQSRPLGDWKNRVKKNWPKKNERNNLGEFWSVRNTFLEKKWTRNNFGEFVTDCPSNAASSPRNDSLLRTTLALQHLAHVRLAVQASNQIDTPPVNPTNCQNRDIDSTDLSFPLRSSSYLQRLDLSQLPATIVQLYPTTRPISAYPHQTSSCISTTWPTPATLVERPAAHNHNSTIPAIGITHPS